MKYEDIEELSYERIEGFRHEYRYIQEVLQDISAPSMDVEVATRLMQGAIDVHTHPGPDPYSLRFRDRNDIAMAKQAAEMGMAAIVIKAQGYPTARSAYIDQIVIDEWAQEHNRKSIRIIGGIVLNYCVGGLNRIAVELTAKMNGKFIWTPQLDSSHQYKMWGKPGGIEVVEGDHVVPQLREIFEVIAKHDLVLSLCHHTTRERLIMIDDAKEVGVKRMELVHVNQPLTQMSIDQMKLAASKGAYLGLYGYMLNPPEFVLDETVAAIREVGADHFVLGTDLGGAFAPDQAPGYRRFLLTLLHAGIPEADVEKMARINPERLIF